MKPKLLDGIHYIHLRYFDDKGFVLGKGGQTLAWEVVDDSDNQLRIKVGRSICSVRDNFWRKKGREIARNRLILPQAAIRVGDTKFNIHGEIVTRHTLREDIHEQLEAWAYGAV